MADFDLTEPWVTLDEGEGFEQELRKEVGPGHVLFKVRVKAIARRIDNDDILFQLEEDGSFAVVHLTWMRKREKDNQWPYTELFRTWDDLLQRMVEDNRAYEKDLN